MTAVAPPPSVQSVTRLGWYSTANGEQSAPASDDVSRKYMPPKTIQRTNSSSSLSSSASSSTVGPQSEYSNAGHTSGHDSGNGPSKKKPSRYVWSGSKSEPVSGVTNARPQPVSAPPSGTTASSAMSALHHPSPVASSQHVPQSPQQNGIRGGIRQPSNEPTAILSLIPLNGTFEKKQITVPYFPEVLRIGRQTNGKTVPSPTNGYFDSKVLSRQHAEIWADRSGKIWIRDVKSSNGTFINGQRLSPESRESDPHELREHDTLELGIDIISEDQKTIVHHKVSAKVEHAGIYGPNMNIMDLSFGDIDPTAGGGSIPSHLSQPIPHMRGRQNSTGSVGSNRSTSTVFGGQLNALHQQRQMNYWHSPLSIEQVVKKLSAEMKYAKEQAYDLTVATDFMTSLLNPDRQEKEKSKPFSLRQANGRPKAPRLDSFSRFSDPPAPPPKQPLPEKPDAPSRTGHSDPAVTNSLKRSEAEKSKASGTSPVSRESSQILSLVEALASARKELDAQCTRVKELEDLLTQERAARENAEERARRLESLPPTQIRAPETDATLKPIPESEVADSSEEVATETKPVEEQGSTGAEASPSVGNPSDQLQQRLEKMMAEMDEMRKEVERYKESAEQAQKEAAESRKTLAEMVEKIRRERTEATPDLENNAILDTSAIENVEPSEDKGAAEVSLQNCAPSHVRDPDMAHLRRLDESMITPLTKQRYRNHWEQSAPYASMLGVVLLGVGIMAYLNGWQKVEK
ncbi:hypothetical protein VTO42DRAFT_981 [Malbranchea cinnamomea]